VGRACPVGIMRSQGRLDHIRRRPISARDAQGCRAGAMRPWTSEKPEYANFGWSPTPMGENFSGSCIVTSRNPLIHIGATTATNSERFGAGGLHQGLWSRG
jgi:hypothetical protein